MKLLTISNLYPRPDQPQRGLFNAQLFAALAEQSSGQKMEDRFSAKQIGNRLPEAGSPLSGLRSQVSSLVNICLVPEWRVWKWGGVKAWGKEKKMEPQTCPAEAMGGRWRRRMDTDEHGLSDDAENGFQVSTMYLPVFYIPVVGRSLAWWFYLYGLKKIKEKVLDCDVVFSTWLYPDGVTATLLAQSCNRRSWIMVQGSDAFHLTNGCRRRVILDACRKAEGIVCVCKSLAERMIDAGVESAKVHVVPNGVNGELFRYRSKEDAISKLENKDVTADLSAVAMGEQGQRLDGHRWTQIKKNKIILFVGNLVPVKAPDILLEAWKKIVSGCRGNGVTGFKTASADVSDTPIRCHTDTPLLLFIGAGPMRSDLEQQAVDLGIADSVVFLSSRPHEEIALWMNVADCLCLPSRNEGMPNVVVEALVSGLPVVATDVGGVRELLDDQEGSVLVKTEPQTCPAVVSERRRMNADKHRWHTGLLQEKTASGIVQVLGMQLDRKAMAERNRGRFSWDKQSRTILNLMSK